MNWRVVTSPYASEPLNSSNSGTSHMGGSSFGWYQVRTMPLRSTVG